MELKIRKARAVLALIAFSDTKVVSRQHIASLLWSNSERANGLARLRDVLHHLQRALSDQPGAILDLQRHAIGFQEGMVSIDFDDRQNVGSAPHLVTSQFLADLEGIDPAFDRWLTQIRDSLAREQNANQADHSRTPAAQTARILRRGPTIVVTEFAISADHGDPAVIGTLTDEVAGALSKMRWFSVISGTKDSHGLRSDGDDLSQIADYALIGQVQSDASLERVSVKLIDIAQHGAIVWAANFERESHTGFAGREKMVNALAASLDAELMLIEAARERHLAHAQADNAYSLVVQAVPAIYRLEREPFLSAGHRLEQAVAVDQEAVLAHSFLALWHVFFVGQGWATHPSQSSKRAANAAERAMLLDPRDARAFAIAGHAKAYLGKNLNEAMALHEQALQINSTLPLAWHLSGVAHAYAGRHDEAYRQISHCLELAPRDPHAFFAEDALCIVHLLKGDYASAVALGRRVTERHPHFASAHKAFLSALGHAGRTGEAASIRRRLMQLDPSFSLRRFRQTTPIQRPEDLQKFITGLRLAGVE